MTESMVASTQSSQPVYDAFASMHKWIGLCTLVLIFTQAVVITFVMRDNKVEADRVIAECQGEPRRDGWGGFQQ